MGLIAGELQNNNQAEWQAEEERKGALLLEACRGGGHDLEHPNNHGNLLLIPLLTSSRIDRLANGSEEQPVPPTLRHTDALPAESPR